MAKKLNDLSKSKYNSFCSKEAQVVESQMISHDLDILPWILLIVDDDNRVHFVTNINRTMVPEVLSKTAEDMSKRIAKEIADAEIAKTGGDA